MSEISMPFCPECGTKNSDDSVFCGSCGTKITGSQSSQSQRSSQDFSTQSSQPNQRSYQQPSQSGYQSQPSQTQPGYQPPDSQYMGGGSYSAPVQQSYQRADAYRGDLPATRSWGMWFLGSILLFGIPYIIYSYLISEDLNKLERASSHQRHGFYKSTEVSSVLMVVLFIVFPPVFYYLKFNTLHEHLKKGHNRTHDLPMSGAVIIGIFIANIFLFWTIIVPLVSAFVLIYAEYKWQEILNQHIREHGVAQNY